MQPLVYPRAKKGSFRILFSTAGFLCVFLCAGALQAQYTWNGSVSNEWFDGANWDGGTAPGSSASTSTVIIDNKGGYDPHYSGSSGSYASVGPMIVGYEGTGSLSISGTSHWSLASYSDAYIGYNPGSEGSVVVGNGGIDDAWGYWSITGNLTIGKEGTGSLTIDRGQVNTTGYIIWGEGGGSLDVRNNGNISTRGFVQTGAKTNTATFNGARISVRSDGSDNDDFFQGIGDILLDKSGLNPYATGGWNGALCFESGWVDGSNDTFNITINNVLTGDGGLSKSGSTVLMSITLTAANLYTGDTWIDAGSLILGEHGSIDNSSRIFIGNDTWYYETYGVKTALDVSAKDNFTVHSHQIVNVGGWFIGAKNNVEVEGKLRGLGTLMGGTFTIAEGGVITPCAGIDNYDPESEYPSPFIGDPSKLEDGKYLVLEGVGRITLEDATLKLDGGTMTFTLSDPLMGLLLDIGLLPNGQIYSEQGGTVLLEGGTVMINFMTIDFLNSLGMDTVVFDQFLLEMTEGLIGLADLCFTYAEGIEYSFTLLEGVDIDGFLGANGDYKDLVNWSNLDPDWQVLADSVHFVDGVLTFKLEQVPEPGTWALILGGLGVLGYLQRARRKS